MNKILSILLLSCMSLLFVNCTSDDNGGYVNNVQAGSEVYDLRNVNFEYKNNGYQIYRAFDYALAEQDVILIYRQAEVSNGTVYWEPIPKTFYLEDGNELDFTFDFSRNDITIYAGGTFNLTGSDYIRNQTFRVVVIPAAQGRSISPVNTQDYNEVIKYYNINDKNIINL
ncbi:hypothetical protein [Faecalibacter rhinopitheci]|uniref:Uncharacterized protein n=1 Tax=Faecalibacter rhinopitheci TaxID=2779678 RepID=A0A8J7FPW7_9FLAO|nr:hypothetical protein [Faecalibacter rhinopitheci]MBF0597314.1 hypothetical protein [Faecalibacter rhinopitheci]MBQ0146923.1 hypothetical protein [Candidatus Onthonaster equi]